MPSGFLELAESQPPCRGCLAFERAAVIGDQNGPGLLGYNEMGVVVDRQGNFWVGQVGTVTVFGPSGTFLHDIGRRGQGPFEFQEPRPVFSDADGNVHIFAQDIHHKWARGIEKRLQVL